MAREEPKMKPVREEISAERAKEIMSSTPILTPKALDEQAAKRKRTE